MCKQGSFKLVRVKIPAELSCSGKAKWKKAQIDTCIAPIVEALQKGGIDMRGSCCGHGKGDGDIQLQDGRTLVIKQDQVFPRDEIDKVFEMKDSFKEKHGYNPKTLLISKKAWRELTSKIPLRGGFTTFKTSQMFAGMVIGHVKKDVEKDDFISFDL